jgi:hypothetical protein
LVSKQALYHLSRTSSPEKACSSQNTKSVADNHLIKRSCMAHRFNQLSQ